MAERRVVEAKEPFSVTLSGGTPFVVNRGDRFFSDDQVVKGRERLFTELVVRESRPTTRPTTADMETASAGPGSRRTVSRPPSPKPADKPAEKPVVPKPEGKPDA